jgi:hypothetical protein
LDRNTRIARPSPSRAASQAAFHRIRTGPLDTRILYKRIALVSIRIDKNEWEEMCEAIRNLF